MANKLQLTNNTNSPRTPKQGFQLLKYPSSFANDSLQSHSAPGSPVQPSPKGRLNNQSVGLALSPSSNSSSLLPLRMRTENNDNQRPDLFNMRSHTEGSNTEEYLTTQSDVENLPRQDSKKSFGKSDTKNGKRSKSAKKIVKCPSPVSRSLGLWAKENIAEGTIVNAKDMTRLKKRTRSSVEKINKSVGGESLFNSEKKRFQSSLDVDLGINEKNNAEEEGIQGLFEEENVDREGLSRETGPIRYSKMSEEDAATMFEIRRKELLSFLMKLGSSSAVAKKKLTYNKNAGLFKQNMPTGQSSDMGKLDFPTGKALRRLQDSLKRSISPTQFIIYNTATDPMWNNNANSQAGKFATPAKDKKLTNSMKVGCESAPDGKLRNSAQFLREKEELNPLVERNLEASFNQLFEWSDTADKRSPMKMLKRTETTMRSNNDEKIDGIESITIDLTKASKSKKKKSKKVKNDQEKAVVAEKVTLAKQLSEDMGGSSVWEQSEIIVDKPSQKAITELRKKNQAVLNEIDEIDGQIERMKEIDNRQSLSQRRVYDNDDLQKEQMRKVFDEDSQEGYLLAAKVKKNAERSRSLSLKFALKENSKNNESMQETNTRGGPKSKENVREGSQSRRNQKVRFAGDANENSQVSVTNVEVAPVETKEKTLVRVPSQTNTLKFDLTKNKSEQSKDRQTPVPKRALSNNPANGARKGLQEMNLNMPMNAVKDNTKDLKLKTLELGKGSVSLNQSFNTRTSQTTTNKTSEKNRLITDFSNIQTKENQQSAQQLKKKISKTYETNSTLQTVREHLLTTPSPKELVFSLRKTPTVGQKPETPLYRREPSNSSMSSKTLLNYKKPSNSSLPSKNNIRSVSDKDYSADTFQIPNLFESHSTTSIHESISPGPKIPFTKEIKRIVKEEPKEEKPTAAVLRQKSSKSKENIKTIKDVQIKPKKGDANRPTFSIANSAADLRSKIFRRQNQENSLLKPSLSPNHSKLEIKQAVHEDLGMSSSFSKTKPLKKSETDKNNLRKGSLSTPRGFRLLSSPAGQGACLAMSLQDLKEKLAQRPCTETSEDMESLDSFRLREKSLNLPLHPNQGVRQNEDMDSQELMKDSQGLKRKKAAGYSIC